jgi:hypothetical protein
MRKKKAPRVEAPLFEMQPGEEEAMLLSLALFAADVTSERFDHMSGHAREWMRLLIGLSAEQFQAACLYLAAYQKKHRDGLAVLRAGFECEVTDEPRAERLQ